MESCAQAHLQSNLCVSVPSPILRASTAGSVDWVIAIGNQDRITGLAGLTGLGERGRW